MYYICIYDYRDGKWHDDNLIADYRTIMGRLVGLISNDTLSYTKHRYQVLRESANADRELILYAET